MNDDFLLNSQLELLTRSGYDQILQAPPNTKSGFMERLKLKLMESKELLSVANDRTWSFHLGISGVFNNRNDLVYFLMEYQYDALAQALNLKTITARLGEKRLDFSVNENKLPGPEMVYRKLKDFKCPSVSDEEVFTPKLKWRR